MLCMICIAFACRKPADSPCFVTESESQEVTTALEDVVQTGLTYSEDPTQGNCLAYQEAFRAYLDIAKEFLPCWTPIHRDELREGIKDAEEELASLDCR